MPSSNEQSASNISAAVLVRDASEGDIAELVEFQVGLFTEDAGVHERYVDLDWQVREGQADFEMLLESDTSIVLVAELEGRSIGFLVGYTTPSAPTRLPVIYAVLRSLFVIEAERNSGAGSQLVEAFIERAEAEGASEAHVSAYAANTAAHRFYERHGFVSHSITKSRPLST